jgi:tRNA threonylcarbamoyladenosine biosynthesis protein TsaE
MHESHEIVTQSVAETKQIASKFVKKLHGGEVIALYGDLGSGKTTFTQGIAGELGIKRHINSPTFILLRTYDVVSHPKIKRLYHLDLYRTQTAQDIEGLGLYEIMEEKDAIIVIEWPEKIGNKIPDQSIMIRFDYVDENKRKITFV